MDSNLLIALGIAIFGILAAIFAFGLLPGDNDLNWRGKDLRDPETGGHRKPRRKSRLRRLVDRVLRRGGE